MKKKLDASVMANELREGSVFFQTARRDPEPTAVDERPAEPAADDVTDVSTVQSPTRSTRRSTNRPTDPPTGQPPQPEFDTSPILGRPKAFYITERQDQELDIAVTKLAERLRGRSGQKIDRSILMRLLLESSDLTADATADRLAGLFVRRLVSQLTG